MYLQEELADAAGEMAALVRAVRPEQLHAPTPCAAFDVRGLINHLISWCPIIEAVALGTPLADGRPDDGTDHMAGDWRADYLGRIDRIVAAWKPGSAWEGQTDLGFARPSASMVGLKAIGEFVLHGWDLARALDRPLRCAPATAAATLRLVERSAEESRRLGMYGPAVAVSESAPDLDRALGASGRDPRWTPVPG